MTAVVEVESKPAERPVPWLSFQLDDDFVDGFRVIKPPFGGYGLGEATFYRTYSRSDNPRLPEGKMETWTDTCRRVVEGMQSIEQEHCLENNINWNAEKAQISAQRAFTLLFHMKWMPPGRGLWMMGSAFVHRDGGVEALQNCAFVSTGFMRKDPGEPFDWTMTRSMLGVGVGFDVRGAGTIRIYKPRGKTKVHVVDDSREGWGESVHVLLNSFLLPDQQPIELDYSQVRPGGLPIKRFGGVSSGPEPLILCNKRIEKILRNHIGDLVSSRMIADFMNIIGTCVVSGNVRRSAEIALGFADDEDFIGLKDFMNPENFDRLGLKYGVNDEGEQIIESDPENKGFGWMSNNSVFVEPTHDPEYYMPMAEKTWQNGEPGYFWLDNVHNYARMNRIIDQTDSRVLGSNPCVEQVLEHKEMCTLGEIFASRIENLAEAREVVKQAYRYCKLVTILNRKITDPESREVMTRNHRIGLSQTGIAQIYESKGEDELIHWLSAMYGHVQYYDDLYSQWYQVPKSIRTTSVKPSGTITLLPTNVTPGIHFSVAGRYIKRRVNMPAGSNLTMMLQKLGYEMEDSKQTPNTWIVSFPVDMGSEVRSEAEVSPDEQLLLHSIVTRYWADNNASQTIKFDRDTTSPRDLAELLAKYDSHTKGLAFLPLEKGTYEQMPYEAITEDEYYAMIERIPKEFHIDGAVFDLHQKDDKYCDGDSCEIATFREGGV